MCCENKKNNPKTQAFGLKNHIWVSLINIIMQERVVSTQLQVVITVGP